MAVKGAAFLVASTAVMLMQDDQAKLDIPQGIYMLPPHLNVFMPIRLSMMICQRGYSATRRGKHPVIWLLIRQPFWRGMHYKV